MTVRFDEYTAWYIPDGYSEPLTKTFTEDDFPPYGLRQDEKVDFMLNEIDELGVALEIRGPREDYGPGRRVWHNKSWGID